MAYDRASVDALIPLPPATFHILMAVAEEDRHGYAILLDVEARVMPVINEVVERHIGQDVLVVGHGGVNRIILLNAIGAPLAGLFNIEQNYGCLNIIDYYADGRATVKLLNGQE